MKPFPVSVSQDPFRANKDLFLQESEGENHANAIFMAGQPTPPKHKPPVKRLVFGFQLIDSNKCHKPLLEKPCRIFRKKLRPRRGKQVRCLELRFLQLFDGVMEHINGREKVDNWGNKTPFITDRAGPPCSCSDLHLVCQMGLFVFVAEIWG